MTYETNFNTYEDDVDDVTALTVNELHNPINNLQRAVEQRPPFNINGVLVNDITDTDWFIVDDFDGDELDSDWTVANSGESFQVSVNGIEPHCLVISRPSQSSGINSFIEIYRDIPTGWKDYRLVMISNTDFYASNYPKLGIGNRSNDNKIDALFFIYSNAWKGEMEQLTNFYTWSSTPASETFTENNFPVLFNFYNVSSDSNVYGHISLTNQWTLNNRYSHQGMTSTRWMTPTKFVITAGYDNSSTQSFKASIDSFIAIRYWRFDIDNTNTAGWNKFTYPFDFSNAIWTKSSGISITSKFSQNPEANYWDSNTSSNLAQKITDDGSSATNNFNQIYTGDPDSLTGTLFIFARSEDLGTSAGNRQMTLRLESLNSSDEVVEYQEQNFILTRYFKRLKITKTFTSTAAKVKGYFYPTGSENATAGNIIAWGATLNLS